MLNDRTPAGWASNRLWKKCRLFTGCLLTWFATATAALSAENLVPAQFNPRTDSQGFSWDVQANGMLGNGNGCFNQAFAMTANNMGINFQRPMMTANGSEFVFSGGQLMGLDVTRRVKVDSASATIRYVESFHNPSSVPIQVAILLHAQMQSQAQSIVSDLGTNQPTSLGPKESGLLAVLMNNMPSPLFFLAGSTSKLKPALVMNNNFQLQFVYNISVPAGKTVSIVHGAAMRRPQGNPDAKTLATLFKPFRTSSWLRDVPSETRATIVNLGSSFGSTSELPELLSSLEELNVTRGPHDLLLVGDQTRLQGTLVCPQFKIETHFGPLTVPLERIAAIIGGNGRGRTMRLLLRDGQVFAGPLAAADLKFVLTTGLPVSFDLPKLDRLVLREAPGDGQPGPNVFALVDLFTGDLLAIIAGEPQQVRAVTNWGSTEVALGDIDHLAIPVDGALAHRLVLKDGSSYFAFLTGKPLELKTQDFGAQKLEIPMWRAWRASQLQPAGDDKLQLTQPHAVLAGNNVFVGQIDIEAVHLISAGQEVPIPPSQIKVLHNQSAEDDTDSSGPSTFRAELWDGDVVVGTLRERALPLRGDGRRLDVPAEDVLDVFVSAPTVPDELREKIAALIRELGHADWQHRETASKELSSLGSLPRLQFAEALKQATDPEVRKRLQALLDAAKE